MPRSAAAPVVATSAVAAYVMHLVAQHTIEVVRVRHLLPRWDLATHLGHGWLDYHLLVTGQVHRLLWDLWSQGYWPPGLSVYQVPFYLTLGGELTSGLWSAPVAFVLLVATGSAILVHREERGGLIAASVFTALLISSPYLLAYASVAMTETLGALAQAFVLFCYQRWRRRPDAAAARLFAVSLTMLFFVKYNYFLLLAVPLAVYEWLEHTAGWPAARRMSHLWSWLRRALRSPTALFVLAYLAALVAVVSTGGFQFDVVGQRVSVRGVGNSGLIVLYLLLLRLWYLHRRGRLDARRVLSADPRIRPLLLWFLLPVIVWLASPHPNHLRDFANLVINRPLGEASVDRGTAGYLQVLRATYFYSDWVVGVVLGACAAAALRYRAQPPIVRLLLVAAPLQFAVIALHHTRFPRFLLLTVVLICLAAASELGRWLTVARVPRAAAAVLAPVVLMAGILAARQVVAEPRFTSVAFENYTDSEPLRRALAHLREELRGDDRLLIVGQNNELSPALFRWELGPPSGEACFPFPIGGAARLEPALATHVLLLEPLHPSASPLDAPAYDPRRFDLITRDIDAGDLVLRREYPLRDLGVAMRLYARTSRPPAPVPCR